VAPKVVWDTSRGGQVPRCKKCNRARCVCNRANQKVVPEDVRARVKLEQRKGKQVTVVSDLPHNPDYFKKLLKTIKTKLSCGGALKEGNLEIQGDQREKVRAFLEEQGFDVR
jgi:translation initiation factor 1